MIAFGGPEGYSSLAIIAFEAFQFTVPKYYHRLGKVEFEESQPPYLRRLRSSRHPFENPRSFLPFVWELPDQLQDSLGPFGPERVPGSVSESVPENGGPTRGDWANYGLKPP